MTLKLFVIYGVGSLVYCLWFKFNPGMKSDFATTVAFFVWIACSLCLGLWQLKALELKGLQKAAWLIFFGPLSLVVLVIWAAFIGTLLGLIEGI